MTYLNHIYIKFIFQMFGMYKTFDFVQFGSVLSSVRPVQRLITLILYTKVHKMYKVGVLCGIK